MVFTMVGRIVEQKVRLFFEVPRGSQDSLIDCMMDLFTDQAVCIILGTGDTVYERLFTAAMQKHPHCIYLKCYSAAAARFTWEDSIDRYIRELYNP